MRFLVDLMCGGVVSYLRMCGHDTVYAGDRSLDGDEAEPGSIDPRADDVLAVARSEDRTVVTRDVALANRAEESILLESREVEAQLAELSAAGVALALEDEPAYCGRCNGHLERVEPTASTPEYAPDPSETTVWRCLDCGQHFWKGSHWDRVRETLSRVGDERSNAEDQ